MGSRGSAVLNQQHRRVERTTATAPAFRVRPQNMSLWSSAPVPDSAWADENFLLGAGMVVFQPATRKVVVIYESQKKYWFLPKGRKDIGESLEQTALREAYEESGYRVEFLPLYTHTSAPVPPSARGAPYLPNCEPIYICTASYAARTRRNVLFPASEYLSFWYVGQIPADAVPETDTRMPDEINYQTHLLDIEEATQRLYPDEARVVRYAAKLAEETRRYLEERPPPRVSVSSSSSLPAS
ncbi:NUDIX hydrolase domain-like protein [Mycena belliarum]|uniref:NUDIX hydrolase domain-like protein n=1 Tax=Mycena belliarum TaxID=1033014 RepID=A0AAD6UBS7_9AGAR|nr:NUDIX hydrolase domain-like protein [Mycena belliae]